MRKTLQIIKISFTRLSREIDIDNGDTITNRYDIANTFNNYFASIAETTKNSIKYFHLSNETSKKIFLQPTDEEEISNILSSLNSNKASGPNSTPYRILFPLKHESSIQLADLFQLLFHEWCFPFCNQNWISSSCF